MKFDSLDSGFVCTRLHQVPSNRILTKLTLRLHLRSLSVHCEFSRIVCVSLFSYQCSLCPSLRQLIHFITFISVCQELFSFFWSKFFWNSFRSDVSLIATTCISYHKVFRLSTIIFAFFKTFWIVYSLKTISCDSSIRIPLSSSPVNTLFYFS